MRVGKKQTGFTIVELLIVIVVIGILAALVLNSFSNAQKQAQDAKTIDVTKAWVKGLKLYQQDTGHWPVTQAACLGSNYPWGNNGADTTTAQCRADNSSSGVIQQASFEAMMRPYMGQSELPTPNFTTVVASSGYPWYRGVYYYHGGAGVVRVDAVFTSARSTCPQIGGLSLVSAATYSNGLFCAYAIGNTADVT